MNRVPSPQPSAGRRAGVIAICLIMLAGGTVLALTAGSSPVKPGFPFPALLLLPLYLAALRKPLDFEYRKDAQSVTLVQFPLALGVLLVPPIPHLLICITAQLIESLVLRRDPVNKQLYNVGSGALEVGLAATAVGLVNSSAGPGPMVWLAVFAGVLAGDIVGQSSIQLVFALLGRGPALGDIRLAFAVALISSLVFTGFAVVTLTAAWTDPATLVITTALAIAGGLFYRSYRKQSARERNAEELYKFVKELGPLTPDGQATDELVKEIRSMLHCRHLVLSLRDERSGTWFNVVASEGEASASDTTGAVQLLDDGRSFGAEAEQSPTQMSTTLLGIQGLIGTLTASERLGTSRTFEIGDLRLMETISVELTLAFERGRLLSDLQRSATTDVLTGLPNLAETSRLVQQLLDTEPTGVVMAAVAVDSFREVNDTLGHEVGDDMLVEVTARLLAASPGTVVGRTGGGRFAVAAPARMVTDASMFGLALRARVEGSAQIGAVGTHVKLSVGCVRSPEHGRNASTLLRRAETAMYSARHTNGGPLVWEPAYEVSGQRRLAVVTALREALDTGALGVAYQPKVDLTTGVATGMEALARWHHPALGTVRPDEFVPLAEASGLIGSLTSTVMRESLAACAQWQATQPGVGVAVNTSALTLLDPSFASEVAAALRLSGLRASLLTLELTESVLLQDPTLAVKRLNHLASLGVRLSVDDFGTGYSSLTYLKGLPVHEVKIDKGFIDEIERDPADRAVVRAVVDIAHTLGLKVVAEGVEFVAQRRLLIDLGVDELQGYLVSKPMSERDTDSWLARASLLSTR